MIDDAAFGYEDEMVQYGRSESLNSQSLPAHGGFRTSSLAETQIGLGVHTAEEFENHGPAAFVDTQTASSSQWVQNALDKESNNFFEYVKNTIQERQASKPSSSPGHEFDARSKGKGKAKDGSVTFEELFQEGKHSTAVAAQAFYHVLCLVTRKRVWAEQELVTERQGEENVVVDIGRIRIGVV